MHVSQGVGVAEKPMFKYELVAKVHIWIIRKYEEKVQKN